MTASGIAAGASILGVALARHFLTVYGVALSTGGVVSTLLGSIYLACAVSGRIYKASSRKYT